MPIYGYRCGSCGHELEVRQSMSDAPLRVCPECGGALSKLLYPVGVQFKGSGFYTTDYRNGKERGSKSGSGDGKESPPAKPSEAGTGSAGGEAKKSEAAPGATAAKKE